MAPDRAGALSRLSGVLLARHEFGPALSAARQAVAADADGEAALGALFDAALAAGAYPEAEAAPALAWCLAALARLVHAERGPEAAVAVLRESLRVQPGYRGAVEQLADLAAPREDRRQAEARYRQIATAAHPDLYRRLAELSDGSSEEGSRAAWEQRFLQAADSAGEALIGRELALYLVGRNGPGDAGRALAIARRELARRPTVESHDLLAWIHFRRGELGPALAASDRALAGGAPSPAVAYYRGRILEALGRRTEAARLLQHAAARPSLLPPDARRDAQSRSRDPTGRAGG